MLRSRINGFVVLLIAVSLLLSLLPAAVSALPSGEGAIDPTPVPPQPTPQGEQPHPTPVVVSPPAEEVITPPQPRSEPAVETQQAPLPGGVYTLNFSGNDELGTQAGLPLTLQGDPDTFGRPVEARVEILEPAVADKLSPVGLAFTLDFVIPDEANTSPLDLTQAQTSPELVIDYSQLPLRYGGDFAGRLTLYRVTGCRPQSQAAAPSETQPSTCNDWQALPSHNELSDQQLVVTLVEPEASEPISDTLQREPITGTVEAPVEPEAEPDSTPPSAQETGGHRLYLPLVMGGGEEQTTIDGPYFVLASGGSGDQGDYGATPLSNIGDHQVGLFSGAVETNYPIPLPPPAAGPEPEVRLNYNSGSVDGMHSRQNNQPGWVGVGWQLWSGAIIRHLKPCNYSWAPGDLCLTGDDFSITLNGTTSRLVKESGNLYYLQSDPRWKVELYTDGPSGHPDAQKEYWWVTTPDGTRYRFGGEIEAETGADQNSAFYVTVYDYTLSNCDIYALCDKVWQWNLDRVEDTHGNVISYFYEQEHNYYKGRNDSQPQFRKKYVRAGHLSRIEYTKRAGQTQQPHARVLFNTELRCVDPTTPGGCDWPDDFPDTPGDLACEASGTCSQNEPTFWSQRRLDKVQTQIYDQTNSRWQTVGIYDLSQSFPEPPTDGQGDTSEKKLWLDSFTQRPGGDFTFTAFGQIEAETFSAMSGLTTTEAIDVGRGLTSTGADDADYLLFKRVDFGSGANTVLARLATALSGSTLEFRLDSTTGTKIAEISVSNTGGGQNWASQTATVSGASGIHDLYVIFKGSGSDLVNLNWFRFTPASGLPGQPPIAYDYEMLANKRNYDLNGVSPMFMPRIDQVTTELGGVIDFTYGQSHPCPTSAGSYIRLPYDCFVDWDSGDPNDPYDDGWTLWQKWKVTQLQRSDSFSGNPTETESYSYSTPTWHYSDDPSLPDINSCSNCPTRHWNDFRGHEIVTVTDATGAKTEYRFYRGMNDDRLSTWGGSFAASITLSDSSTRTDHNWLRGQVAETRQLQSDDTALDRTVNWYSWNGTAGSGSAGAYFVGLEATEQTQVGTTTKTARTEYLYDSYGNITREVQKGDTATGSDDRTLERSYLANTSAYIVDRPEWEKLWAGTAPGSSGSEQAYTAYAYDNQAVGVAPTDGDLTLVRRYHQASPGYAYYDSSIVYDSQGRPTSLTDANSHTTTTAYHSFYGTVESVTNALTHVTSFVYDPGRGQVISVTDANNHTTTSEYDDYGRLKKVWLPTETTSGPASYEFNYAPASRPAYAHSRQLYKAASSTYLESWRYVDGFGREIQSQRPSLSTGQRVVSSQAYDNRGQSAYTAVPYEISGVAGSGYVAPTWTNLTSYRRYF